ncbi:MAG: tRNA epoxyqueuosine(34) reductase QueG [Bauldia sp.]|nr:tRNA epoxyqueuosine(34) reductase QueG [Bauldia sp.]MCW5717435.1 tRNA epoxyqueuosine(34) reductase QueG [Bauldia sp.]
MVREDKVPAVVPPDPRRPDQGREPVAALHRPGLLGRRGRREGERPKTPAEAKASLVADAKSSGFDVVRVAAADAIPEAAQRLREFLAAGRNGTMDWLADTESRRSSPRALWPEVSSVVMLGFNYGPEGDPRAAQAERERGAISVYARGRDYHDVLKGRLKTLASRFKARFGGEVKVFVDTAPVMEKPLAAAAGLGWQGKHTNLVSREFGSWLFLGALFTTLELPRDEAAEDACGSCRACLDACPTAAFPAPYQLDARRCISYLTIEHAGPIPRDLRLAIGNRIYGCDDCLAACPWNKFAVAGRDARLAARADLAAPPLAELAALDEAAFRARFPASPVKRIGRDRFVRNVLVAIGNSGAPTLLPSAEALLDDPSPAVRGAAVWAVRRLAGEGVLAGLRADHMLREADPGVLAEWEGAP